MTNEIKFKGISIGFDTDIIGIGIGVLFNRDSRVFAISLFGVFILLTIPRLKKYKAITIKMSDYRTVKIDDRMYFIKPHPTFIPRTLFIRDRRSSEVEQVDRFKIHNDRNGFSGVLVYRGKDVQPTFFRPDEYYFVSPLQIVRGYINHRDAEFIILSIVD